MPIARELLDGSEHQIRREVALVLHEPADASRNARVPKQPSITMSGLAQELLTMGEKQQPRPRAELLVELPIIEGCEPGLAEPRGEHHERAPPPVLCATRSQAAERLALSPMRLRRSF